MGIRVLASPSTPTGDDTAFGDLSLLSVGYGLHQAWVYAVMFGTPTIFGTQTYVTGMYGSHASLPFLVSIVVFTVPVVRRHHRPTAVEDVHLEEDARGGRGAHVGRTLLLLATPVISGPALEAVSGVMTGIGPPS